MYKYSPAFNCTHSFPDDGACSVRNISVLIFIGMIPCANSSCCGQSSIGYLLICCCGCCTDVANYQVSDGTSEHTQGTKGKRWTWIFSYNAAAMAPFRRPSTRCGFILCSPWLTRGEYGPKCSTKPSNVKNLPENVCLMICF